MGKFIGYSYFSFAFAASIVDCISTYHRVCPRDTIYIIVAAPAPERAATRTRTTSSTTFHQLIFFMLNRNLFR